MTVIFEKMAVLVFLLAAGYCFARVKFVRPDFHRGLSKLVMNFFLPATILNSVVNKELNMSGAEVIGGLGLWLIMFAVAIGIAWLTPRLLPMKNSDGGMVSMMIGFSNTVFVGFPVVAAMYGNDPLFFASLSNIPFNLTVYTIGILFLSRKDQKLRLRRAITTPLVTTLIAVVIFSLRIRIPGFLAETVSCTAGATVPLSMMCVGLSLGSVSLKDAFCHPNLYLVAFIRLILCPVLTWLILRGFVTDPVLLGTVVIISATPSAILCTILGLEYGRDGVESSEGILLTTVLSMLTIPLLITVLGL